MDNRETRLYFTKKQALSVIPDSDHVHIFCNTGHCLVGTDLERKEIIE